MKKLVSALLALVLVLSLSAALAEGMMTGGWEIVPAEGAVLPDEAVAALEKALEKMDGASYVPVTLMATQIGAGLCLRGSGRKRGDHERLRTVYR